MGFISNLAGAQNNANASNLPLTQNNYSPLISTAGNNALSTTDQQNALNASLLNESQGNGPVQDLTQAQLLQASGQAQQQAAGATAAQKGMNPALMARQILQNNAAQQQAIANQSAINKGNLTLQAQGAAGNNLAATQQGNLGTLSTAGGLQNQQNTTQVQQNLGTEGINAGVAGQNANTNANVAGGIIGGVSGAGASALSGSSGGYSGGKVFDYAPGYDDGGYITDQNYTMPQMGGSASAPANPNSISMPEMGNQFNATPSAPSFLTSEQNFMPAQSMGAMTAANTSAANGPAPINSVNSMPQMNTKWGSTLQGVNTGIPDYTNKGPGIGTGVASGMTSGEKSAGKLLAFLSSGGDVPGTDAPVPGNSPKNDTVPAWLSPGEIVIPRSITMAPDAPQKAADFVAKVNMQGPKGSVTARNPMMPEGAKEMSMTKVSVKPADKDDQSKVLDFIDHLRAAKMPKNPAAPDKGFAAVLYAHQNLDQRLQQLEELARQFKAKRV